MSSTAFSQYNNQPHYMQSEQFGEYMAYLGWESYRIGKEKQFLYVRHVPVIGKLAKAPKLRFPLPFADIQQIVDTKHIRMVRMEPNVLLPKKTDEEQGIIDYLRDEGYKKTWLDCELKTLLVDVTQSEDELFAAIPRENTRRNIRLARKNGLLATESDDINLFANFHRDIAKRQHFYPTPKTELRALFDAFIKTNGARLLFISDKRGEPLVGIFLLIHEKVAYYRYVGSATGAEDVRANTLAVWESILLAKRLGCVRFDFAGINDPRHIDRKWRGFTQFKKGFSNQELQFVLPVSRYYGPIGQTLHFFDRFA